MRIEPRTGIVEALNKPWRIAAFSAHSGQNGRVISTTSSVIRYRRVAGFLGIGFIFTCLVVFFERLANNFCY